MKMRIILASILMLALFAGVSQAALTDGLIAYWDFEDDGVDVISDRTISDLGNRGQYTESENGLVGKYTRVWASDNVAHPNGTGFKGSIGDLYSAGGITDEMTISTWYGFGNPQGGASVVPFGGYGARAGTQVYDLNAGTRMMASMCKFRNIGDPHLGPCCLPELRQRDNGDGLYRGQAADVVLFN